MRFHLLIWPSTLKVILITIFKNQSNCVIKVKKKFFLNQRFNLGFYNVLLWLLKWGWVTPLPSFSMFSWIPLRCCLSSVHPPQITQIKLYDTRYSTESKGAPTQPPSGPVSFVSRARTWARGSPQCRLPVGIRFVAHSFVFSSFQAGRFGICSRARGSRCPRPPTGHVSGAPGEGAGWKLAGPDCVAKNMNKWSSIPQME